MLFFSRINKNVIPNILFREHSSGGKVIYSCDKFNRTNTSRRRIISKFKCPSWRFTHKNMHTNIRTHTHLHKIPPLTHRKHVHTNTIIYTKILIHRHVTHTRNYYTKIYCHNIQTYPSYAATHPENVATETIYSMERNGHYGSDRGKCFGEKIQIMRNKYLV